MGKIVLDCSEITEHDKYAEVEIIMPTGDIVVVPQALYTLRLRHSINSESDIDYFGSVLADVRQLFNTFDGDLQFESVPKFDGAPLFYVQKPKKDDN